MYLIKIHTVLILSEMQLISGIDIKLFKNLKSLKVKSFNKEKVNLQLNYNNANNLHIYHNTINL